MDQQVEFELRSALCRLSALAVRRLEAFSAKRTGAGLDTLSLVISDQFIERAITRSIMLLEDWRNGSDIQLSNFAQGHLPQTRQLWSLACLSLSYPADVNRRASQLFKVQNGRS